MHTDSAQAFSSAASVTEASGDRYDKPRMKLYDRYVQLRSLTFPLLLELSNLGCNKTFPAVGLQFLRKERKKEKKRRLVVSHLERKHLEKKDNLRPHHSVSK
jgi:hypothetical protein